MTLAAAHNAGEATAQTKSFNSDPDGRAARIEASEQSPKSAVAAESLGGVSLASLEGVSLAGSDVDLVGLGEPPAEEADEHAPRRGTAVRSPTAIPTARI